MHLPQKSLVPVALVALVLAGGIASAAPASAAPALAPTVLTCQGSETDSYSPALTNTPTTIAVTSRAQHTCLGLSSPSVTKAAIAFPITQTGYSCTSVLRSGDGSSVIDWGGGRTSTFRFSGVVNVADGTLVTTQTGTITSGLFAGSVAVRVITGPQLGVLECAGQGVAVRTGTSVLTVGGLG